MARGLRFSCGVWHGMRPSSRGTRLPRLRVASLIWHGMRLPSCGIRPPEYDTWLLNMAAWPP
eukprot:6131184-Prymnesium_polylepis.1